MKPIMPRFIPADSTKPEMVPAPLNCTDFSLKELQAFVGGYIETLHLKDGQIMVINEDGKSLDLPLNRRATEVARTEAGIDFDHIVGDVVIIQDSQLK